MLTLVAALVVAVAVSAGGASAANPAACSETVEQPFLAWLDPAFYVLAPGGDFEGTSAWSLGKGVKQVRGNEPYLVHNRSDQTALSIPAGSGATSPAMCVGLGHPTLRLFAKGGDSSSRLKVEVIYPTVFGTVTQPVGYVTAHQKWAPTIQMAFLANVTGLLALDGLTSKVQFRFTAQGSASWLIDDVYIDPWKVT